MWNLDLKNDMSIKLENCLEWESFRKYGEKRGPREVNITKELHMHV
jgi:hypothetical protein